MLIGTTQPATQSLAVHPSVAARIAKVLTLIGQGEYDPAMGEFDSVFRDSNSREHELLGLIKVCTSLIGNLSRLSSLALVVHHDVCLRSPHYRNIAHK